MPIALHLDSVEQCVDHIIAKVGHDIRIGLPLGLGKPTELINALYQRAKANPEIKLTILTALSLEKPDPGTGLQKRLLEPFFERVFGGYPDLDYMRDLRANQIPDNIDVHEFFFKSGAMLGNDTAQQNYICTNYTHSVRDLLHWKVNVVAQMLAHREVDGKDQFSMSCNPETTRDLLPALLQRRQEGEEILIIGEVNDNLPFMLNDAIIEENQFDVVIKNEQYNSTLFAPPNMPVTNVDYIIGLHTSTLIKDGGTLQIGIGSLGDAIVYGCESRDRDNEAYNQILDELKIREKFGAVIDEVGGTAPFEKGLYGSSEMFVGGFYDLIHNGILRRKVYDNVAIQRLINEGKLTESLNESHIELLLNEAVINNSLSQSQLEFLIHYGFFKPGTVLENDKLIAPNGHVIDNDIHANLTAIGQHLLGPELKQGRIMHGGFFLGPAAFYEGLKNMDEATLSSINMTNISYMNQLYGQEELKRLQRTHARFVNTVFLVHALGAATSDGLDNGKVVSGVGGQYNFVAQAHELEGARSILMLKSTREKNGVTQSNIVWNYGHTTIPRHLRDIYVTEYGIADVRGKCDKDVIAALINIADSRFQPELLAKAKQMGKLPSEYTIPDAFSHNTPDKLDAILAPYQKKGLFPPFPCGSDFTQEELVVARCLKAMKRKSESKANVIKALLRTFQSPSIPDAYKPFLNRVQLGNPTTMEDKIAKVLMLDELAIVLKDH